MLINVNKGGRAEVMFIKTMSMGKGGWLSALALEYSRRANM